MNATKQRNTFRKPITAESPVLAHVIAGYPKGLPRVRSIPFDTFREACERLTKAQSRRRGLTWLSTSHFPYETEESRVPATALLSDRYLSDSERLAEFRGAFEYFFWTEDGHRRYVYSPSRLQRKNKPADGAVSLEVFKGDERIETVSRVPQACSQWQWVTYRGKRYQLFGGIRGPFRIQLDLPLGRKAPSLYPSLDSLDSFTEAYITCALWSSNDESTEQGGEPLDRNYDATDISRETLSAMVGDCQNFQRRAGESILSDLERAGHDFWLTRNGHGAGFWDGDWPEPDATTLTELSKSFGECNLYLGDDSRIYHSS